MRATSIALACFALSAAVAAAPAVATESIAPAASAPPIVQNRDEPGRNPYQVHAATPSHCNPAACAISFPRITVSEHIVVQQVSCQIIVLSQNIPLVVFLAGRANDGSLYSYLPMIFQNSFGNYYYYVINTQVLYYFYEGDAPFVGILSPLGTTTPPSGDCALRGYRVILP